MIELVIKILLLPFWLLWEILEALFRGAARHDRRVRAERRRQVRSRPKLPRGYRFVTLNGFECVQLGMTYPQVTELIQGQEGELIAQSTTSEKYRWWGYSHHNAGANMLVTFNQGRVASKAQRGLEYK